MMWLLLFTLGTSTGALLAAALGINHYTGERCVQLYRDLIREIFKNKRRVKKNLYDATKLEENLKEHFQVKRKRITLENKLNG